MTTRRRAAALIAVMLAAGGCGTRVDHAQVREAAGLTDISHTASGAAPVDAPNTTPAGGEVGSVAGAGPGALPASSSGGATSPGAGGTVSGPATPNRAGRTGTAAPSGADRSAPAGSAAGATASRAGTGTGAAAVPTAPAVGGAKSPITIGTVGVLSGPVGTSVIAGVQTIQLWARWKNDSGGINGHQVRVITGDDGGDPARHRALMQDFVENRKVIAFVGNPESLSGRPSVEYITAKRVPVIGSDSDGSWFYESPMYFPPFSTGNVLMQSMLSNFAAVQVPQGKTKLGALVCVESATCQEAERIWADEAKGQGMDLVYRARTSLTQPDFTAECLQAKQAGVQVMSILLDGNTATRLASSCARQGFHPAFGISSINAYPRHADDANLDGMMAGIGTFPWFLSDTPGRKEFRDVLARYAPDVTVAASHAQGWVSAKLFERAAQNIGEPPTSDQILDGLWSVRSDDLGGLTGPLTFTKAQTAPRLVCWGGAVVRNKAWVSPDDGRIHCRH